MSPGRSPDYITLEWEIQPHPMSKMEYPQNQAVPKLPKPTQSWQDRWDSFLARPAQPLGTRTVSLDPLAKEQKFGCYHGGLAFTYTVLSFTFNGISFPPHLWSRDVSRWDPQNRANALFAIYAAELLLCRKWTLITQTKI